MVDNRVPCITAYGSDFQSCPAALCFVRELPPIHAWQTHIRDQQLDVGNRIEHPQPGGTVRCIDNHISDLAKHLDRVIAHIGIVVDDKNRLSRTARWGLSGFMRIAGDGLM